MKVIVALGANQGDRLVTLNAAAAKLDALSGTTVIAASSAYENPPHLPSGAPPEWYKLFLNAVLLVETELTPIELLHAAQQIEQQLGRKPDDKWAPRPIDIDLINYDGVVLESTELTLPHPRACTRSFVPSPLVEIAPDTVLNGRTALEHYRRLTDRLPAWMQIVNVTPDSFSGDGLLTGQSQTINTAANFIDLGGESTRPNAQPVPAEEEWRRLELQLVELQMIDWIRPRISVDTRHAHTARLALEHGVDLINDVSGLNDPEMLEVIAGSHVQVAVMHNLGVPVNPDVRLSNSEDPVPAVMQFLEQKLEALDAAGIPPGRVWIDPGIGFGKSADQSWWLMQHLEVFHRLGTRILAGHSRKSFLKTITAVEAKDRDVHTVAVSQALKSGAEMIRVHNVAMHRQFDEASWRMLTRIG